MTAALLVAALLAAGPVGEATRQAGAMMVAIPAANVVGEVPPRVQAAFEQSLLAEVRKLEGVAAIGAGEIGDVLAGAGQGSMRGCTQNDACLLEVANALGLTELLSPEIELAGDSYTLSFRRLGAKTGKVLAKEQRRVPKGNGSELLGAIGPAVEAVYPDRKLRPGAIRGVAPEAQRRLNPPPLPRSLFVATATATVVALAAGGTFAKLSSDSHGELQALVDKARLQPVPGVQYNALQDRLDTNTRYATLFLGVGAALAAAAGLEAFFTDWHDDRSKLEVVAGPAPGVALTTRF